MKKKRVKKAVVVIPEPLFTWMWRVVMEQWRAPVPTVLQAPKRKRKR